MLPHAAGLSNASISLVGVTSDFRQRGGERSTADLAKHAPEQVLRQESRQAVVCIRCDRPSRMCSASEDTSLLEDAVRAVAECADDHQ